MKHNKEFDYTPIAVVTGASTGIGLELAKVFAKNGYDLLICSDTSRIEDAAIELRSMGCEVETVQADLASRQGVQELCDKMDEQMNRIEAVAINAGVGVYGKFHETNLEEEMNLLGLNVIGAVHLGKHVVNSFMRKGRGRILFTSSIAAEMPGPYYAVYAASKAFLQSFSQALHRELKDSDITVTALQPGATDTFFFERAGMQEAKVAQNEKDDPSQVAQDGYDALMAGKDHVVAGSFMNKVQTSMAKFATEQQQAAMHESDTRPERH